MFATLVFGLVAVLSHAQAPVPFINQPLAPDATAPGGPQFTLTVNGTGFVSNSTVNWNGSPLATTFVSGSRLTAVVPAADIATSSTGWVTVVNPAPGGGTSNVVYFPITSATTTVPLQIASVIAVPAAETATAADFNGDGKLDLAVTGGSSDVVSILLGNGDGTFQPPVDYPIGLSPRWVITGDFNGDGNLDLACGGNPSAQVSILLGNGDGTFQPAVQYATGNGTYWGIAADFNSDGKLDLALAGSDEVSILLGKGDGSFPTHVDYYVSGAWWVGAGDFNGDGKLDLAAADHFGSQIAILLGNGDGTFQPEVDYHAGISPRSLQVVDLNGDGKLDLAVANETSGTVSILLGNGDGSFQPNVDYPAVTGPTWIQSGDFNGDGKLDVAVSSWAGGSGTDVAIFLGNGDGTLQPAITYQTGGVALESGSIADFNGDGRLDLAVPASTSSTVSILLQGTTVTISKKALGFSDQLVGTTSPAQTVTLNNTGGLTLTVSGLSIVGTNSTDFGQTNTCGSSIPPGGSCTISVTFTPTAQGTRTAAVAIKDSGANSPQTISLRGTGTVIELLPASLNFGNQAVGTASSPQTVTMTNTGSMAVKFKGFAITGTDFGDFAYNTTCTSSISAGQSCTVNVTFTPQATGVRQATLGFLDNGGGSPQKVPLSGTGD